MIDFELMTQEGLLPEGAYQPLPILDQVDFAAVKEQNGALLRKAYAMRARSSRRNCAPSS